MPTLEEFFEEAIEQADPENMVDKEFKYVPQIIFFIILLVQAYIQNIQVVLVLQHFI